MGGNYSSDSDYLESDSGEDQFGRYNAGWDSASAPEDDFDARNAARAKANEDKKVHIH